MKKNEGGATAPQGQAGLPPVSVVITTYNRIRMVGKAIESALRQYYGGEVEVIVVDDGSSDGTGEMIKEMYDGRVRYSYKLNGGMNSASQLGIELAKGDVIALLDSDDYWYDGKLATCMPLFLKPDVVAVMHDLHKVDVTGRKFGDGWRSKDIYFDETPRDGLTHYLAGKPIPALTTGWLMRRDVALKTLPFPPGLTTFHDAYFARHVIFYGKICAVREALGAYVFHDTNDYASRPTCTLSDYLLERAIIESKAMCGSFHRRCQEFGVQMTRARERIQNISLAGIELEKYRRQGIAKAILWIGANEYGLGLRERLHLLSRAMLPPRAASFVNNRILVGAEAVD